MDRQKSNMQDTSLVSAVADRVATCADEVGALVFDLGHYSLRAGYAGEETPKSEIPATVGVLEESAAQDAAMDAVDAGSAPPKETPAPTRSYSIDTNSLHVPKKSESRRH